MEIIITSLSELRLELNRTLGRVVSLSTSRTGSPALHKWKLFLIYILVILVTSAVHYETLREKDIVKYKNYPPGCEESFL